MSTLLINLPATAAPNAAAPGLATTYSYVLSPDGQAIGQHGHTSAHLLPQPGRTGEVLAVVPAQMLSWHRVHLPQGMGPQSPRLRAVLEGLLEERLLDEPAELHFALQPGAASGMPVWVACCPRAWLRMHLGHLEAAGLAVARVVPSHAPGEPSPDGAAVLITGSPQDLQAVVYGTDAEQAVVLLPLTRDTAELLPDLPADTPMHAEPAVLAGAERLLQRQLQLYSPAQTMLDAGRSDWNLAQLEFASSGRSRLQRRFGSRINAALHAPAWKPARWGLAALAAIALIGANLWAYQERQQLAAKAALVRNTLTQTFPKVTLVVNAPMQMAREVALLRQASGALTTSDLESLLAAAGQALTNLPAAATPRGIDYSNGELRLRGLPTSDFEAFAQHLSGQGLQADLHNDQWVIRAQLQP